MESIQLGNSDLPISRLAYGCWRIAPTDKSEDLATGRAAVLAAWEAGYTFFDHADIYCGGRSESLFGRVLREVPELRDGVVIATKCGIRFADDPVPGAPYRYDFSPEYIVSSCEGSLRRLGVERIDLFQLHRPDYLGDPHAIAGAFAQLLDAGKVRAFGVSNCRPTFLTALQQACPFPLVANQIEISLAQRAAFEDGTLDQCLAGNIVPMAWSPLGGGQLADGAVEVLPSQEGYGTAALLNALDDVARARNCARGAVALAWLLKHPAKIVPIVGSTRPGRIRSAVDALKVSLSREEWYSLLIAARGEKLP